MMMVDRQWRSDWVGFTQPHTTSSPEMGEGGHIPDYGSSHSWLAPKSAGWGTWNCQFCQSAGVVPGCQSLNLVSLANGRTTLRLVSIHVIRGVWDLPLEQRCRYVSLAYKLLGSTGTYH